MSHKHEQLLKLIFHDPISGNIHWREIESLLNYTSGAEVESLSGARIRVKLNRAEGILHAAPLQRNERAGDQAPARVPSRAGATPSMYEASREAERKA